MPEERPPLDPELSKLLAGEDNARHLLLDGRHTDPHTFLGPHGMRWVNEAGTEEAGTVVRVREPFADSIEICLEDGQRFPMTALDSDLFAAWLPGVEAHQAYRLECRDGDRSWQRHDPYRFPPTLGDLDLYLISEGTHRRLWECLGARPHEVFGVQGYSFSVWAPNARRVSLVGEFCAWDGRCLPMRRLGSSGVFEIFLPDVEIGELYKLEILGDDGTVLIKADPMAMWAETAPGTASRLFRSRYAWQDQQWMDRRARRQVRNEAMAIYELHVGSWKCHPDGSLFSYRELAEELVPHLQELGFDTLELLPIAEHPFTGSWGYQITGYYAPTARYGDPDDLRYLVDRCHQAGIAVILDWVPGHFVRDAHGLARFDGTALYEHLDPRRGWHPDWGTYIFNLGRREVQCFLLANALYWLDEFHFDGLRVDAVASMLYLDYSRKEGEWLPNALGGKENLEAVDFLRRFNQLVQEEHPGCFTAAEESTSWPGVTKSVEEGGLGFTFKWNMGWMHDTLAFFQTDPLFRQSLHDRLTFAIMYEYSEHFLNPLSHDEVVHGKGSLLRKMAGDGWQRRANLRALLAYQITRPGKVLLFMGTELGPDSEWDHDRQLDWSLAEQPARAAIGRCLADMLHLYREHSCLWQQDHEPDGFAWVACDDRERSVLSYVRRAGEQHLMVILNLTPVPRTDYRVGAHAAGYRLMLNTDQEIYGGSGYPVLDTIRAEDQPADGLERSLVLTLPPLSAMVLQPIEEQERAEAEPKADTSPRSKASRSAKPPQRRAGTRGRPRSRSAKKA